MGLRYMEGTPRTAAGRLRVDEYEAVAGQVRVHALAQSAVLPRHRAVVEEERPRDAVADGVRLDVRLRVLDDGGTLTPRASKSALRFSIPDLGDAGATARALAEVEQYGPAAQGGQGDRRVRRRPEGDVGAGLLVLAELVGNVMSMTTTATTAARAPVQPVHLLLQARRISAAASAFRRACNSPRVVAFVMSRLSRGVRSSGGSVRARSAPLRAARQRAGMLAAPRRRPGSRWWSRPSKARPSVSPASPRGGSSEARRRPTRAPSRTAGKTMPKTEASPKITPPTGLPARAHSVMTPTRTGAQQPTRCR